MKLVAGLGNPGEKYEKTRHNAGYLILDELKTRISNEDIEFQVNKKLLAEVFKVNNLILIKPLTFMNDSGKSVAKLAKYYKINIPNIWVIHDDLDIKLGQYKIQQGIGPKVHYGVGSIEKELGRNDFWRVRIGVDNRNSQKRIPGEEYVLKNFGHDEMGVLEDVVGKVVSELSGRLGVSN